MCVEYLEKHLVDEEAKFEIPELEVTKVTSDVAKHLADIAPGDKEGKNGNKGSSVVTESQKLIETLQRKAEEAVSYKFQSNGEFTTHSDFIQSISIQKQIEVQN